MYVCVNAWCDRDSYDSLFLLSFLPYPYCPFLSFYCECVFTSVSYREAHWNLTPPATVPLPNNPPSPKILLTITTTIRVLKVIILSNTELELKLHPFFFFLLLTLTNYDSSSSSPLPHQEILYETRFTINFLQYQFMCVQGNSVGSKTKGIKIKFIDMQ